MSRPTSTTLKNGNAACRNTPSPQINFRGLAIGLPGLTFSCRRHSMPRTFARSSAASRLIGRRSWNYGQKAASSARDEQGVTFRSAVTRMLAEQFRSELCVTRSAEEPLSFHSVSCGGQIFPRFASRRTIRLGRSAEHEARRFAFPRAGISDDGGTLHVRRSELVLAAAWANNPDIRSFRNHGFNI